MEKIATGEAVLTEIIKTCEEIITQEAALEMEKKASSGQENTVTLSQPVVKQSENVKPGSMPVTKEGLWGSPLIQGYIHERLNGNCLVQPADIQELAQCIGAEYGVVIEYLDLVYPYRRSFVFSV